MFCKPYLFVFTSFFFALLVVVAPSAEAIEVDNVLDICGPSEDPCQITGEANIVDGTVLDFGLRTLTVTAGGRLDYGAGSGQILVGELRATPNGPFLNAKGASGGFSSGGDITLVSRRGCSDAPTIPCLADADCDGGTCSVGTGDITIDGKMAGNAQLPATLTIRAAGDVEITRDINIKGTDNGADGGLLTIVSTMGSVRIADKVTATSGTDGTGGIVVLSAAVDVILDAEIDTTGGNAGGGQATIDTGRDYIQNGTLIVDSGGGQGVGGRVRITTVRDLVLTEGGSSNRRRISAAGNTSRDLIGGDGGLIELLAGRDVVLEAGSQVEADGANPNGTGGDISIVAAGDVSVAGDLRAISLGLRGRGGFIAITSPARIDILEGGVVDLFGTLEGGGTFEANSGGVFSSFGTIDVTGGNDGPAGHVDIESQDLAVIAGTVTVAGRSNAETEGLLLVTACFTEMRVGGLFDNRVEGGESRLVGRESVTLRLNAELRATNSGLNHLVYGEASQRPVIFGIVSPKAVETLDETLEPCPRCGNNEIEQGESCDDGNVDAGDGCDADCVDEGCIADTPGYPAVPLCDDSDACTLDSCDSAASECVFVPSCNDGVDCSTDACEEGECVSTPNDAACNDADVCTDDICSLLTGCASIENTSVCDDGLFCTVLDSCTDGVCSGQPRDCSDGIDCTQDSCDEARNTCEALATDSLCADDLFCNGDETCNESSGCEAGTPPECSGLDDQCLRGICDEGPDFCSTEASNEGAGCDDGLFCTVDDACTGGVCAGQARDCSDGIECTVDACDELLGACAAPLSDDTACADDLFCNGVETCNASSGCEAGEVSDCSAFDDQCLVGTCDEALDSCAGEPVNDATVCDDGNVCTENDSCLDGLCVGSVIDDCATCGNDVVEGGETCDDGDVVFIGGDACDETCQSVSCGYPLTLRGDRPRASDALHILRTSVEQRTCALSVCDVSGNGSIQASDALRVLRAAVGQVVELDCTQAL